MKQYLSNHTIHLNSLKSKSNFFIIRSKLSSKSKELKYEKSVKSDLPKDIGIDSIESKKICCNRCSIF